MAKIVKHLAPLGWRTVVVTSRRVLQNVRDDGLAAELPATTEVLRTVSLEPLRTQGPHGRGLLGLRRALNVPLVPSVGMMWAMPAFASALLACRRFNVDVVMSSGPDFSSHVLAAALRATVGVPTVLDYRDEWTTHFERVERLRHHRSARAKNHVDRRLERQCLRLADRVVLNTPAFRAPFITTLGCEPSKLTVVPNGYDVDELERHQSRPPVRSTPFTLVHVGSINRRSQIDLAFFELLRARAAAHDREVRIRFVGAVSPELVTLLDGQSHGPLRLERLGFLSAREALEKLRDADAALLLQESAPGTERYQNLKLFDYLGARVPILAVAPDPGEITRVIRECGAGAVADPSRIPTLRPVIDEWLIDGARVETREEAVRQYAWPALATRLAAVLEEAVALGASRHEDPA